MDLRSAHRIVKLYRNRLLGCVRFIWRRDKSSFSILAQFKEGRIGKCEREGEGNVEKTLRVCYLDVAFIRFDLF